MQWPRTLAALLYLSLHDWELFFKDLEAFGSFDAREKILDFVAIPLKIKILELQRQAIKARPFENKNKIFLLPLSL